MVASTVDDSIKAEELYSNLGSRSKFSFMSYCHSHHRGHLICDLYSALGS